MLLVVVTLLYITGAFLFCDPSTERKPMRFSNKSLSWVYHNGNNGEGRTVRGVHEDSGTKKDREREGEKEWRKDLLTLLMAK